MVSSDNKDIIAVVGPCIEKVSYEVKAEFCKKFIEQNKKNKEFFEKKNKDKLLFDLRGYINKQITNSSIANIENIKMDTFSDKENFYSYRRACLNGEKDYGRCISVILMT